MMHDFHFTGKGRGMELAEQGRDRRRRGTLDGRGVYGVLGREGEEGGRWMVAAKKG